MRSLVVASVCVLIVAFSGCMGGGAKTVSATDSQFTPNSLSVKQNDKVSWKNDGNLDHTVTIHKSTDNVATTKKDDVITKGSSTDFTFQETGTFHVYCKYHSSGATGSFANGMVMTVTVS